MERDNLQTVMEIFTNRGFNIIDMGDHIKIGNEDVNYSVGLTYIKNHNYVDDLIVEISSKLNQKLNKRENIFVKKLISKRVAEHVDEYIHTGKKEYMVIIPPCKCSRYELLKEEFNRYRTVKFTFLDMNEEGAFQSVKYKISNK